MQTKWICIVDYNLTRIADVKMMVDYASQKHSLRTVLIRANPTSVDQDLADLVINLDPLASNFATEAEGALGEIRTQIAAVLPFSDNSVVSGAQLAERLNLRSDNSEMAKRAFSKLAYRQAEFPHSRQLAHDKIMAPAMKKIATSRDLVNFIADFGEAVLKPSCEGNNRGVIRLSAHNDLEAAFNEVAPYLKLGVIAEQVIPFPTEFSLDGLGHLHFITRKLGVSGRYPVECGQIVGTKIPPGIVNAVTRAGSWANVLCGQRIGPFHNEIKYDPLSGMTAIVEPNRRPAGMRIWHLAEKAFGINFFHLWIDQMITGKTPLFLPTPERTAGIRMLGSSRDGLLTFPTASTEKTRALIDEVTMEFLAARTSLNSPPEIFDFQWNQIFGSKIPSRPSDNSQFVAQVCMTGAIEQDLEAELNLFAKIWENHISSWITKPTSNDNEVAL